MLELWADVGSVSFQLVRSSTWEGSLAGLAEVVGDGVGLADPPVELVGAGLLEELGAGVEDFVLADEEGADGVGADEGEEITGLLTPPLPPPTLEPELAVNTTSTQ